MRTLCTGNSLLEMNDVEPVYVTKRERNCDMIMDSGESLFANTVTSTRAAPMTLPKPSAACYLVVMPVKLRYCKTRQCRTPHSELSHIERRNHMNISVLSYRATACFVTAEQTPLNTGLMHVLLPELHFLLY